MAARDMPLRLSLRRAALLEMVKIDLERQWQLGRLAAALGDAIRNALAPVFQVLRAGNRVDANHVLGAARGIVGAAGQARRVFLVAHVVDGAEFLGLVATARIVEDDGNAGSLGRLYGFVFRTRNPIGDSNNGCLLRYGGAHEIGGIATDVVIGLELEVVDCTAMRLDD